MKSTVLCLAGILALGANALVLERRTNPSVLAVPFVREPTVALRHRKRSGEVLVPLMNEPLLLYTATLQIGTPPQTTRVQIDTGSSYLIVETDVSDLCASDPTVCTSRGSYHANTSSTYEYVDSDLSILYGGGDGSTGDDCFDTLTIGGADILKYRFGIMYKTTVGSGVLGISYQPQDTSPFQGTPQEGNLPTILASQGYIASRAYSLWLNDAHASSGQLLFGGVDTEKFKGNLVTIDIVPEIEGESIKSFIIPLVKVTLTDSAGTLVTLNGGSSPGLVNLDSGTTFFSLPSDIANSIYTALNAVVDQGSAFVDCSLATTSTTINLGFQGITIAIPINQLMLDGGGGTSCQLGLSISSGTSFLGDTALTSMYVVYDMDNNQISLAPTVFNAEASNILQIVAGSNGVPKVPGVGGTTVGTSTTSTSSSTSKAPTSTKVSPLKCKSDNCLRAFGSRPEAAAFCATYTAGGSQVLPTYAVKGCSSSAFRVSSACSCINTGIVVAPTTTPTTSPTTTLTTTLITSKPTSTSTSPPQLLTCKKNNCLRAMQHSSVTAFCSSFLAGQPVATPAGVAAGCMNAASRISSGCACVATIA